MMYDNIIKAVFKNRPNRFIAVCSIDGEDVIVHVKNTGRCKELLVENTDVYLEHFPTGSRKTKYDLISVNKNGRLINMDSYAPNKVVFEALKNNKNILNINEKISFIKMEQTYKNSRFDIYAETNNCKIFAEIKGVTLEKNNMAMFPDAPTQRGIKHIMKLIDAKKNGFITYIIFVIQMEKPAYFTPNYETHKEFGEALKLAQTQGVNILSYDCIVTENSIALNNQIDIRL